jgi:two-component system sensor histidine kinase MtrB
VTLARLGRFGLRTRVAVGFAVVALLVSVTLAAAVSWIAKEYLVSRRESLAVTQASVNAQAVAGALRTTDADVASVLASVPAPRGEAVVFIRGRWYSSSLTTGSDALPHALRTRVMGGQAAIQRVRGPGGEPTLVVGLPVARIDGAYFEAGDLRELDRSLRTISSSAGAGAAIVTAAAVALGWWASGRVLRPVADAAAAATAIAGGDLSLRLPVSGDGDLDMLANSFNAMVATLAGRSARDAQFASDVSHELRSPLTSLSTAVQVLQNRRHELAPRSRAALDLVSHEVARFERLVLDLLEISRYDAGAPPAALTPLVLSELLQRTVAERSRPVPLRIGQAEAQLRVLGDKRRLERVVTNLLDNADAYGDGAVALTLSREGHRVRLLVDDAGPGVPVADRNVIFERFARGRAAGQRRSTGGVGLGLALVAEHVRFHGGRVWVEGAPAGGARFVVELPVAPK